MSEEKQALQPLVSYSKRAVATIDRFSNVMSPPDEDDVGSPTGIARGPIMFGLWMFLFVFVGVGLWAAIAPLASAAIATGKVVLDSNRKTIQHLEGGIIDEILVSEGSVVEAGETLLRLNETAAKARYDLFQKQYNSSLASEARLVAERDLLEQVAFPSELLEKKDDPAVAEILDSQTRLFESRRAGFQGQLDILGQRVAQFEQEINGLNAQVESATKQISLLEEEIGAVRTLLAKGNAQKPRLLALQRQQAELRGRRGENQALISRAEQSINEAKLAIENKKTEYLNQVVDELKDTQQKLSDLEERIRASGDIMDRIIISAPISGIVQDLRVHTIGGVIGPGDKLMDLVPNDKLVIEANISPQDIDVVRPGLEARMRLTAYSVRNVPTIEGTVINVSADSFDDERTGATFFKVRIEVNEGEIEGLDDVELAPGMTADVQIVTGERTLISYIMSPIRDSFNKAFREQ